METELDGTNAEAKSLANELGASKAREQSLGADIGRMQGEKRTLSEKLDGLEATLARARQELETRSERWVLSTYHISSLTPLNRND